MAAELFFMPFRPVYDTAGLAVPGAQLYFTLTGTNTASPAYSDSGLATPLSNPVVADAVGGFPSIYLSDAISYRVRIYDRDAEAGVDTPLEEYDPYVPGTIEVDVGVVSNLATIAAITPAGGTLAITGAIAGTGAVTSSGGKIGYAVGAGGTVTQVTSKATGVTLNELTGQITMQAAALAANTTVSFTLTNSNIAAGDLLILNHVSGGTAGAYALNSQSAAGSASINVRNITAGSLSEAIVIGFAVIKGVTS